MNKNKKNKNKKQNEAIDYIESVDSTIINESKKSTK